MKTASQPAMRILLAPVALGLLLSLPLWVGCKEDEAPPPLPSAAPPPPPAAPMELAPEPEVVVDAGEDAAVKKVGSGKPRQSLKACCAALRQNAANAPPPNDQYMLSAALVCDGAAASGAVAGSIVTQLQAALKGAGMPAACQ